MSLCTAMLLLLQLWAQQAQERIKGSLHIEKPLVGMPRPLLSAWCPLKRLNSTSVYSGNWKFWIWWYYRKLVLPSETTTRTKNVIQGVQEVLLTICSADQLLLFSGSIAQFVSKTFKFFIKQDALRRLLSAQNSESIFFKLFSKSPTMPMSQI